MSCNYKHYRCRIYRYKNIEIKPQVVGDVTHAKASYRSAYGEIVSEWKKKGKQFELNVTIPTNTKAVVYFPVNTKYTKPVSIGSGNYQFTVTLK